MFGLGRKRTAKTAEKAQSTAVDELLKVVFNAKIATSFVDPYPATLAWPVARIGLPQAFTATALRKLLRWPVWAGVSRVKFGEY